MLLQPILGVLPTCYGPGFDRTMRLMPAQKGLEKTDVGLLQNSLEWSKNCTNFFFKNDQLDAKLDPGGYIVKLVLYMVIYILTGSSERKGSHCRILGLLSLVVGLRGLNNGRESLSE